MREKRIRFALLCGLLLVITGAVIRSLQPYNDLPDHAEKIASVAEWAGRGVNDEPTPPYFWLNEEEALYFRNEPGQPAYQAYRQKVLPPGRSEPPVLVPGLTKADFASLNDSTRGEWALHTHYDEKARTHRVELASLRDGTVRRSDSLQGGVWSQDGRSVVSLQHGQLVVTSLETGTTSRTALSGLKDIARRLAPFADHPPQFDPMQIMFVQPGERLVVASKGKSYSLFSISPDDSLRKPENADTLNRFFPYTNTIDYELSEFDLAHPSRPPRTWNVPTPKEATYGTIQFSPDGQRILWMVSINISPGLDRFLRGIVPIYNTKGLMRSVVSCRISRTDGSDMHEIMRIEEDPVHDLHWPPVMLWMPDSRHVSFTDKGVLYRAAVR